jgi:hypothetical protein
MKLPMSVLVTVLLLVSNGSTGSRRQSTKTSFPRFEDFPVTPRFRGKPAEPALTKRQAFRTRIQEAARKGPNFAGHYTVAEWGCGSGCVSIAIVDAVSGRLYYRVPFAGLAIPYQGTAAGREYKGLEYRLNSSLLIADGCPEDPESDDSSAAGRDCGTKYYTWERNRFVLRASVAAPPALMKK